MAQNFSHQNFSQPLHAYRPDLYTFENIIGHTGSLHNNPTVYFRNRRTGDFGFITQAHDFVWNVGREPVFRETADKRYVIENRNVNGMLRAVEMLVDRNGVEDVIHKSRNRFIDCRRANTHQLAILASSIYRFHAVKRGMPAGFKLGGRPRTSLWALGARLRSAVRSAFR